MRGNLSLRWRMILLVAGIPLLFLVPVMLYVGAQYRDAYRQAFWDKGELITRQLQQMIDAVAPYVETLEDAPGLTSYVRDTADAVEEFKFIALVDDQGTVYAHSNPGFTGQSVASLRGLESDVLAGPEETDDSLWISLRQLDSGSVYLIARGMTMPGNADQPLYVVVAEPAEMVNPPVLPLVVVGGLAAVSVVLLIRFSLDRLVLSPLHRLAEGAAIVGAGDLAYTIDLNREDELGFVAQSFNEMAARIRALVTGLEERVSERTAALERRNAQLEAVSVVGQEAAAARNVNALLEMAVNAISDNFGFYHTGLFVLDEDKEWAVLQAASSEGGRRMLDRGHRLQVGQVGIVGYVSQTGKPRIAFNVGEDAAWFNNPDLPETQSEMALPMATDDEIVGVLDVQSRQQNAFSEEDISTLQLMADQLTVALNNARTLEALAATVRELQDLQVEYSQRGWARVAQRMRPVAYEYDRMSVDPASPLPVPDDLADGSVDHKIVMDGDAPVVMEALRVGDQTLGYLGLSDPQRTWTDEELALIESIGEQVALALDNARLFEDTQQNERQQVLISRVLQAASDPDIAMDEVLAEIVRILSEGLDMAVLLATFPNPGLPILQMHALVDRDGEGVPLSDDAMMVAEAPFGFFRGLSDAELGPASVLFDCWDRLDEHLTPQDIEQVLYVPIGRGSDQSGVIGLLQMRGDLAMDPGTRELAQNLAGQIAVVLENLNLSEETRQRSEELRQLYRISLSLSELLEPTEVLGSIVTEGARLLDADGANLWLHDSEMEELELAYEFGGGAEGRIGFRQPSDAGLAGRALAQQRTVRVEDYATWDHRVSDLVSSRFHGMMALPLVGRYGPLGVLVLMSEQPSRFSERDAGLGELFSAQAAAALENARLNQAAQRRAEEFSQLYEAGIDLITIRDAEALLDRSADWARRVFEAERSVVFLRQPDSSNGETATFLRGISASDSRYLSTHSTDQPSRGGLTETIVRSRESVLIRDNRTSEIESAARLVEMGLLSQMGTPLQVGDEVLGALFINGTEPGQFGERELDLLEFLAAQISSALQNSLQFSQTEEALSLVQRQARYQSNISQAVALLNERGTDGIDTMLQLMGEASGAPVALYFAGSENGRGAFWSMESAWLAEGRIPERLQDLQLRHLPMDRFSYWRSHLEADNYIAAHWNELPEAERGILSEYGFEAVLGLAVQQEDQPTGFIALFRDDSELWEDQELVAMQTAAVALSNTIARERLFSQVQQTLDETEALYRGSAALSEANEFEDVLEALLQYTVLGEGQQEASLHLFDRPWSEGQEPTYSELVAYASVEPTPDVRRRFHPDRFPMSADVMSGGPHFVEDLSKDTTLGRRAHALFGRVLGAKSVVIVPLTVGGQRVGYFHADFASVQTFSEDQRRRLASLAQQASIVVMNIRQLRATQARVRRERLIRQITSNIQEAPDVEGVLQTAIRELGRAFGTSRNRIQFQPPQEPGDDRRNGD